MGLKAVAKGTGGTGAVSSVNGATGAVLIQGGMRNRIINGSMQVDVRNRSASQTLTAATQNYCVDRFYVTPTGANMTGGQSAGAAPDQFVYVVTGAAGVTGALMGQRIEAANIYDLANTTATFSVKIANNVLTSVTWTAFYAASADNFGTKTQIATGTFTVTSTLATYSTQIALPANAVNGVCIELSVGAQTSGVWTTTEWQLEPGSAATPFERVPLSITEMICQRYCPSIYGAGASQAPICAGAVGISATTCNAYFVFKTRPRVLPTGIVSSAASNFAVGFNGAVTLSALALGFGTTYDCGALSCTVASGLPGANFAMTLITIVGANSLLLLYWTGCEL